MPFDYSDFHLDAIEASISRERFQTYVRAAGGIRRRAIGLYERNTALSEGLYGVVQAAEIAVRNSIHSTLSTKVGRSWFDIIAFDEPQSTMIAEAKYELDQSGRIVTPGGIVAELRLGFWTSLTAAKLEKKLWVPYLHSAFPHALREVTDREGNKTRSPIKRPEVHERLENLRILRNRIAHHEPLLKMDLWAAYVDALRVIGWTCPITSQWAGETNCFRIRFHQKPASAPIQPKAVKSATPRPGLPQS